MSFFKNIKHQVINTLNSKHDINHLSAIFRLPSSDTLLIKIKHRNCHFYILILVRVEMLGEALQNRGGTGSC